MRATRQRLYINIDHVATVRQARGGIEPDPTDAALTCELAGADGITAHLREDRRHIQDADIRNLRSRVSSYFNLEIACVPEMVQIALDVRPDQVTLVPERREEITTEGGLNLGGDPGQIGKVIATLRDAGIRTSLFIDPTLEAVSQSKSLGADAIELHTGSYAHSAVSSLENLRSAASAAALSGLAVHAGHGLTIANVGRVAAIPEIEELNIGHSIIGRSIFVGLERAVQEMLETMRAARS